MFCRCAQDVVQLLWQPTWNPQLEITHLWYFDHNSNVHTPVHLSACRALTLWKTTFHESAIKDYVNNQKHRSEGVCAFPCCHCRLCWLQKANIFLTQEGEFQVFAFCGVLFRLFCEDVVTCLHMTFMPVFTGYFHSCFSASGGDVAGSRPHPYPASIIHNIITLLCAKPQPCSVLL